MAAIHSSFSAISVPSVVDLFCLGSLALYTGAHKNDQNILANTLVLTAFHLDFQPKTTTALTSPRTDLSFCRAGAHNRYRPATSSCAPRCRFIALAHNAVAIGHRVRTT
ncbi:hypothetical protein HED60_10015 [Planctomycetales bacterium ZRK34]|nr:hypothetical protein HED60_10015 [Planctomycetales bacterium ZRK34]